MKMTKTMVKKIKMMKMMDSSFEYICKLPPIPSAQLLAALLDAQGSMIYNSSHCIAVDDDDDDSYDDDDDDDDDDDQCNPVQSSWLHCSPKAPCIAMHCIAFDDYDGDSHHQHHHNHHQHKVLAGCRS